MKKLHLICNAHIDPVWQWSGDEGISAALSTFRSAADLCEEFDYIFCHNESYLYAQVEKLDPELFGRIKQLVKRGKWYISGGWFIQPDCNLPCGESLVRQIRVGQNYFAEKFGIDSPKIATCYDSFGHSVGLVRIMNACGQNGYIICRPATFQFDYPSDVFTWRGADSSAVTVAHSPTYNSAMGKAAEKIKDADGKTEETGLVLWGVGNHGGGPSRKDLKDIAEYINDNPRVCHSIPENFFAEVEPHGEVNVSLVPNMPGCYTSMARVKQLHRKCENLYFSVESMLAKAALCGRGYDEKALQEALELLLFSQFHDILPGTVTADGEQSALTALYSAVQKLESLCTTAAFGLLEAEPAAKAGEYPIFVYNYLPYECEQTIEAEFMLADQNWSETEVSRIRLFDGDREIACQQIKESSTIALDWRKRIAFTATLPPMRMKRFSAFAEFVKKTLPEKKTEFSVSEELLRNHCPLEKPVKLYMYDDIPDPWGMGKEDLKSLGRNPVEFTELDADERREFAGTDADIPAVSLMESGEIFDAYQTYSKSGNTRACVEYRIYKHGKFTDVNVVVEFADKNKAVRLEIPAPFDGKTVGDGPYIVEEKFSDGREFVFQKVIGIENGNNGFYVANDCVYGGKIENGNLRLTLLRGAGYCFHPVDDRPLYPQNGYLPRIDNGRYTFRFRIFRGDRADAMRVSYEFNRPPYAFGAFPHGTETQLAQVFVSDPAVLCNAFFKAGENKYVMRLWNTTGDDRIVRVGIGDVEKEIFMRAERLCSVVYDGKTITETDFAI